MQLRPSDIGELLEIMTSIRYRVLADPKLDLRNSSLGYGEIVHSVLLHFQNEVLDELRRSAFPQPYKRL